MFDNILHSEKRLCIEFNKPLRKELNSISIIIKSPNDTASIHEQIAQYLPIDIQGKIICYDSLLAKSLVEPILLNLGFKEISENTYSIPDQLCTQNVRSTNCYFGFPSQSETFGTATDFIINPFGNPNFSLNAFLDKFRLKKCETGYEFDDAFLASETKKIALRIIRDKIHSYSNGIARNVEIRVSKFNIFHPFDVYYVPNFHSISWQGITLPTFPPAINVSCWKKGFFDVSFVGCVDESIKQNLRNQIEQSSTLKFDEKYRDFRIAYPDTVDIQKVIEIFRNYAESHALLFNER
ncbi:MAG: hypothetical protein ACRCXZ_04585 [Patescibacteria group bacterium]